MCFVVRKARVELKKTVEDIDDTGNSTVPEVVVHNDTHTYQSEISKTNGYVQNIDRSRKKSGN